MSKQKLIVISAVIGVALLWIAAITVIFISINSSNENQEAAPESVAASYTSSAASSGFDDWEGNVVLPQSQTQSSQTTTQPNVGQQSPITSGSFQSVSGEETASNIDPTIDPATNTSKLEPVDAAPKDNGEEQVTAVYYTESDELKGFFSLTGKWVCVYLQLDNWSGSKTITPYDFVLVADGVSYHVSDLNQAGSDPLEGTGVGQNASLQGTLIYEVPLDAEQYQLQYISDNGTISLQLN